jgi:phage terminase small subunit
MSQAARLLRNVKVQTALDAANVERQQRTGVTPERVLRDIDTAANLDIAELFDEHGRLKPIRELPPQIRRAIVSVEVVKRNLTAGDGAQEFVHKVKLIDKGRMHELLARHVGLYEPEVQPVRDVPVFVVDCMPSVH